MEMTDDFDRNVFADDLDDKVAVVEPAPEAEKVEIVEATTAPEDKDKIIEGLHKARDAERHKRQELERKYAQPKAPEVVPDPVTDPDEYTSYLLGKGDAKILRLKIEQSQEMMRESAEDYEDKEKVFLSLIADENGNVTDQKLLAEFNKSLNPAKFAYNHAKKHLDYVDKTSDDYEAKIRARIAAELLADYKAKGLGALDLPNLTNAAAAASNTEKLADYKDDSYLWGD